MELSRRTWQGIALLLLLIAIGLVACGLLTFLVPTESVDAPSPESIGFQAMRGCCLSPAFSFAFLAYLAFWVGRQRKRLIHWSELISALGVAGGVTFALMGLAVIGTLLAGGTVETRAAFALFLVLPGLVTIVLSALFWWWSRGKFGVSEKGGDTAWELVVEDGDTAGAEDDSGVLE